jgi:ABC-type dipeptide/oligopeptide/nickel transport system ATPase component
MEPILEVRDLRTHFETERGIVRAVDKKCLHFQKMDVRHIHPPGK